EAKRIAEMKEKALGSPVLGKQDSRVRASKYLALAMAGAIALGVGHKVVQNHYEQVRAKQAAVQMVQEAEHRARIALLNKAGVNYASHWAEIMKKNQEACKGLGSTALKPFSSRELAELERISQKTGKDERAIGLLLPIFKAARETAADKKELEYERQALTHAFDYWSIDKDSWMLRDVFPWFNYLVENSGKPEVRSILQKLRWYSTFEVQPF
ncbi:MAG: hypothetical protein NTY90_00215, partial [Candidatus Micrarchaeota archaeon]|nr:hypothetical protein [Candidatus Micrarchaeota archaeon]